MKTASQIAAAALAAHAATSIVAGSAVASHATTLSPGDAAGAWVQLLPAGKYKGRDGRGPYDAGDRAQLEKIVQATREYRGTTELVIDYDHQSIFGAVPGVGGTAKAAGWVKEFQVRDDGIWGRVEWTEAAAAAIRAGEYRYLSPVFFHTKAGKVLALQMASLTNTPNLDVAQVAASVRFSEESDEGDLMDKVLAALGLKEGDGEDKVLAAINSLLANGTAIAKALGLKDDAKHEDVLQAVNAAITDRGKLAEAAGLKADAKTDDIVSAVQTAASAAKGGKVDPAKFVPIEQVTALQEDMKSLREEMNGGKAEEAVATAIKDGKLAPALKDWGTDLAKKDLKQFETFVGSAPVLTTAQLKTPKKDGGERDGHALDEAQLATCRAMGLDPAEYAKTLAAEEAEQEDR